MFSVAELVGVDALLLGSIFHSWLDQRKAISAELRERFYQAKAKRENHTRKSAPLRNRT
jgi:hypothetical protein